MDKTYTFQEETVLHSFRTFLKGLLESGDVSAVLVPLRSAKTQAVMPTLVSDPSSLDQADPFSPSFQINGAKLVSKLTKRESEEKIAAVLRPCEVRAFVELVKIHQAHWDNIVIISADCAGAFSNRDFNGLAKDKGEAFTLEFIKEKISSKFDMGTVQEKGHSEAMGAISTACKICDQPFPEVADIAVHYFSSKNGEITIVSGSEKGAQVLHNTASNISGETTADESALEVEERENCLHQRREAQKSLFDSLGKTTSSIPDLSNYLSSCVNCYNCRVACPVCFCKECVFNTDVVDYDPFQYAAWSKARGVLKMPVDTLFFHMTRMIHMGLSCVGCGQCSNACPNDIPLAELFKMVGLTAQKGFEYVPGRDVNELPPLSIFHENEFKDVTGVH